MELLQEYEKDIKKFKKQKEEITGLEKKEMQRKRKWIVSKILEVVSMQIY